MRDYARVSPQFWTGPTGKAIRKLGAEAQVVALYLMTSPHSNMLGLYFLPAVYIANDAGMPIEGAYKALASLSEVGFCTYDDASEMVWVHEMAFYQVAESLSAKDKQVAGINKALNALPKCPQLLSFYEKYRSAFHLNQPSPSQAPSEPLRSKEKEQEKEQEQDKERGARPAQPADTRRHVMTADWQPPEEYAFQFRAAGGNPTDTELNRFRSYWIGKGPNTTPDWVQKLISDLKRYRSEPGPQKTQSSQPGGPDHDRPAVESM